MQTLVLYSHFIRVQNYLKKLEAHAFFTDGSKNLNNFVGSACIHPDENRYSGRSTRCIRKVSDLRSYFRVGAILRHPDRVILRSSSHLIEPHAPGGASIY